MRCLTPKEIEDLDSGVIHGLERLEAEGHLSDCGRCRSAFEQFRSRSGSAISNFDQTVSTSQAPTIAASPEGIAKSNTDQTVATSDAPTIITSQRGGTPSKSPRIDGYTITGVLGQGGMGIVYRAVQTKLNRTVALKVLPAMVGSASPSAVQRFRREATAAARLHHTNIIPIYDFGESADAHYYAMELVIGEPLNDLIRRFAEKGVNNPTVAQLAEIMADLSMPAQSHATGTDVSAAEASIDGTMAGGGGARGRSYFRQVARWMSDAAEALQYAHAQGIIHRDIKPANLILSTDGRIMLADFGLAKSVGEQSVTRTGSLVGTLRYMSPEQAMAKRVRVDYRTDIYSLGATLYELLCFRPAYPGVDETEILSAIISRDPLRPRKINSHVPAELDTICMKCLEKSVEARYETGKALADDLRRYISDLPIVAKRPNIAQRTFKFVRRHKAPVITVGTVLLLVVSVLFWTKESAARRRAEIRSLYDSAQTYVANNRWLNAESELTKALNLDPSNVESLLTLAWFKLEHFKANPLQAGLPSQEQAVAACRKILDLNPDNIKALGYEGIALRRLERYAEAIVPLERARQLDPGVYSTWSNLGTLYAVTGDLVKAEEYMRKGTELAGITEDRWHAAAWRNLAALELFLKKDDAMVHIGHAIQCYSADPWSWVLRARAQMELEGHLDLQGAVDDAKHGDRIGKMADAKAKRVLALAHLRTGDFARAAQEAQQALQLGDEPSINHLILARSARAQGDSEAAAKALRAAQDTWPEPLRLAGGFTAGAGTGDLWIESADERLALAGQASE
jgi:serine/threonine protein kinase